jgi:hypothetical protein
VYLPRRLWFIGLGHLGQGFLWNLGLLPVTGALAMLQDDQTAGEENEATGLLTAEGDEGRRKTRIAARWLEGLGWPTALIERRHFGDIRLQSNDPAVVVTGLDAPEARVKIARAGFAYMVDAGVGHGPVDFENTQIRILRSGVDAQAFWSAPERHKDVDALMKRAAYQSHADAFGWLRHVRDCRRRASPYPSWEPRSAHSRSRRCSGSAACFRRFR